MANESSSHIVAQVPLGDAAIEGHELGPETPR
jgi:hypothetical protein